MYTSKDLQEIIELWDSTYRAKSEQVVQDDAPYQGARPREVILLEFAGEGMPKNRIPLNGEHAEDEFAERLCERLNRTGTHYRHNTKLGSRHGRND